MFVGGYEIYSIVTGTFRLDGGAMFGVVPKALWGNHSPPDDLNRIPLAMRSLLAIDRAASRVVVVDTGCGPKWQPREAQRIALSSFPFAIPRALKSLGLSTEQVTDVVVTHLHFDHNGGLTEWTDKAGGPTRPLFPRARHWVHERQWERAHAPHAKDRPSFLPEDFAGLAEAGVMRFVQGDQPGPPFDGLEWAISHGHTPFQLLPIFGSADDRILFVGDLFPTAAHLRPTWVMAYDVEPMRTIDEKTAILRWAIEEGVRVAFPHDLAVGGVELTGPLDRPIVARSLELDLAQAEREETSRPDEMR